MRRIVDLSRRAVHRWAERPSGTVPMMAAAGLVSVVTAGSVARTSVPAAPPPPSTQAAWQPPTPHPGAPAAVAGQGRGATSPTWPAGSLAGTPAAVMDPVPSTASPTGSTGSLPGTPAAVVEQGSGGERPGNDLTDGATGRRDPFRSLLAAPMELSAAPVRPVGLPGLQIDEVELKATAVAQGRWHAMVTGPDQKAYFLEVGTRLFDGHVVSISADEVLFEQVAGEGADAAPARQIGKRLGIGG